MHCRILATSLLLAPLAQAMQNLDDHSLSAINGQAGISLESQDAGWQADAIDYQQDGRTLSLRQVSQRAQGPAGTLADSSTRLDVVGAQLQVEHSSSPQVLKIGDVRVGNAPGSFGALRLFYTLGASLKIRAAAASGVSGIGLDGSTLSLRDSALFYRDNGLDLIVRGVAFDAFLNNAYLDIVQGANGQQMQLALGNSRFVATIAGIGLDLAHLDDPSMGGAEATPQAPDTRWSDYQRSFGSLKMDLRLGGRLSLAGGGASGEGIRLIPDITISNSQFQYADSGVMRADNFSGALRSTNGITLDLEADAGGEHVKLAFQDLRLNATLGSLILGNPNNLKLGGLAVDLNFADQGSQQNWLKLRPGGDPSSAAKGMTVDASWSMLNSSLMLEDNGNRMWFSGLKTNGTGQFTLDVTKACAAPGPGCHPSVFSGSERGDYSGHFDGLRLGLKNVRGSYSFEGLRVGQANAPLQGGTELLVLTEIFPAYDFNLNGQITLRPGGFAGDGLRFDADILGTDGKAALTVDENGKGLWLTGTTYDLHFRNASLDVSNNGLELRKGEYWSKLDVSDLRWGNKINGASMGRVMLKRYESGSTITVSSGGSGALCVGASGASATACGSNGGRWEDRGNEGLSVKLRSIFVRDGSSESISNGVVTDEKRNQLLIETNRTGNQNGQGSQLVVDNFHTADGDPGNPAANTYGVNIDLGLDVDKTKVRYKSGPNIGQYQTPDPLGFAVNGRIHFREVNIERIQHVHPSGGAVTSMYGIKLQNADMRANLTATPIN